MATLNTKNLPDPLYRRLRKRAEERHRSISQEMTHILTRALEEPSQSSILELRGLGKAAWKGLSPEGHVEAERQAWD